MLSKILSIYNGAIAGRASGAARFVRTFPHGLRTFSLQFARPMVDKMSHKAKVLSFIKVSNILQIQYIVNYSQFY
jgi:hypothetical protein